MEKGWQEMVEEILEEKGEEEPWLKKLENLWEERRKEEMDEERRSGGGEGKCV